MKKFFAIFTISFCLLLSCKSENENLTKIEGEFILIDNAAVIMGKGFIYGVVINDTAIELSKKIAPLQREEYDMVPVVVKGYIKPNTGEGTEKWKEIVEIVEIIKVSTPTSELPTKINTSSEKNMSSEKEKTTNK